jgi:TolA-binding protein
MSDPERLLAGAANDFEKELLGSWKHEGPSEDAQARVLAMVGVGLGGAVGTAGGTAKMGTVASGSIAPKAAAAGTAALVKWLALGAVVTAVGGVAVHYRHRATLPTTVVASAPAPAPTTPEVAPVTQPAPTADQALSLADSPLHQEPARAARSPRHVEPSDRETSLGDQVAALDRARRAMADGNAATALADVAEYQAKYPHGALAEEAEVLRVEALVAQGDRAGASRAGARFLAAHPASPHAAHVRALLGSPPSPH